MYRAMIHMKHTLKVTKYLNAYLELWENGIKFRPDWSQRTHRQYFWETARSAFRLTVRDSKDCDAYVHQPIQTIITQNNLILFARQ